MASSNPWDPVQPSSAALLLSHCVSSGTLNQKVLDFTHRETPCFSHVTELERLLDVQAEINKKTLEIELLRLEQKTADIAHPLYLKQKCEALQAMNCHLEAVLKEKRSLRQRLAKPQCQENLPIEASYHRDVVELLTLARTFIEKLEVYLQAVRSIPQIEDCMRNMDNAIVRVETLEAETEELAEQIMKWRRHPNKINPEVFEMNIASLWSTTDISSVCLSQTSFNH